MSEEDVRVGLLDAVADEPPLRFDPDELMATARGQVRRRALVAAGLATVAVAVAAVAVPAALVGDPATTVPAAAQPTTSPRPSTEQWPPPGVGPTRYPVDHLRERARELREHLRRTLPATLPAASGIGVGKFGGEAEGDLHDGQTSLNAATTFVIDGATYSIMVTTWAPGTSASPAKICTANCHRLDDESGGAVYQQTHDMGKGMVETVLHFRDTGAVVSVAAYNYDMTSTTPPTYHPSLPLTRAQLVTIATDPELAL